MEMLIKSVMLGFGAVQKRNENRAQNWTSSTERKQRSSCNKSVVCNAIIYIQFSGTLRQRKREVLIYSFSLCSTYSLPFVSVWPAFSSIFLHSIARYSIDSGLQFTATQLTLLLGEK